MIEIEKKYKIDKQVFDNLKTVLEPHFQDEYREENMLYNIAKPNVLRVRKVVGPQGQYTLVTHKGEATMTEDGTKSRREVEFSTQSAKKISEFIEALNYRKTLVYEKNRTDYDGQGVTISLDELPFGYFMEIEGNPERIKEIEQWLRGRLGIVLDVQRLSYPDLTEIYGQHVNGVLESRFA